MRCLTALIMLCLAGCTITTRTPPTAQPATTQPSTNASDNWSLTPAELGIHLDGELTLSVYAKPLLNPEDAHGTDPLR